MCTLLIRVLVDPNKEFGLWPWAHADLVWFLVPCRLFFAWSLLLRVLNKLSFSVD